MLRWHTSIRHCLWLLASYGWSASEADRAVTQLMRSQNADVPHVRLLHRVPVDSELDMVLALGNDRKWSETGETVWWDNKTKLGLFLQRRDKPGLLYKIAVQTGLNDGECFARIERVTAADVLISCAPEKTGPVSNHKFVYDIRAKALVKYIVYEQFPMHGIFVSQDKAVLVGTDLRSLVALEYEPGREPAFRLLPAAQAGRWTRRVQYGTSEVGTGVGQHAEIYLRPEAFKPVHFGPDNRFTLAQEAEESKAAEPEGRQRFVMERIGGKVKVFRLPQSSYDDFSLARPARARNGYNREDTTISEAIGPCEIADGTLWFTKSFYDGEGSTGVGGFGYFDPQKREFHVYSPEEIRDRSVTAMLVETDAVWLGLAFHGEWGSTGGGMLRFDRKTQKTTPLALREIVSKIVRVGDHLVMATQFGAALFDGETLRRFFIDKTTDGRLRVAEADPGAGATPN